MTVAKRNQRRKKHPSVLWLTNANLIDGNGFTCPQCGFPLLRFCGHIANKRYRDRKAVLNNYQ